MVYGMPLPGAPTNVYCSAWLLTPSALCAPRASAALTSRYWARKRWIPATDTPPPGIVALFVHRLGPKMLPSGVSCATSRE